MPVAEFSRAKIGHAASKHFAAASKIAVIKNSHARSAEDLHRRNVISKVSGQAVQPISLGYTETVSLKSGIFKKAGPGTRKGPLVPRAIPSRVVAIDPGILSKQQNSSVYNSERKGNELHFNPPIVKLAGPPVISRPPPQIVSGATRGRPNRAQWSVTFFPEARVEDTGQTLRTARKRALVALSTSPG